MDCKHEFVYNVQVQNGYCRCKNCLATFPLGMYVAQVEAKINSQFSELEVFLERIKRQQAEFENRILSVLTEPAKEPVKEEIPFPEMNGQVGAVNVIINKPEKQIRTKRKPS
jgi:hypothetical protein